jgi:hypothetical protein
MPSRTPSNGLERANQKETFQSDALEVELIFTLFSQALEDQHFTADALSGVHRTTIRRRAFSGTGPALLFRCERREPLDERFEARIIS